MAPTRRTARPSNEDLGEQLPELCQDLAAANAEIERLRGLLAAQDTPSSSETLNHNRLADILQPLSKHHRAESPVAPVKSTKFPDPPILADGKELSMRGKFEINADHFPTEKAKMTYVFNRTGGDTQAHLPPRFSDESESPFHASQEMIDHLASILEDPHKVQNARLEYRSLLMKTTETFADFHTRFLHLAGQAKIPKDDLRPDLFDKLTLELQRTVLPVYSMLTTEKTLADQCLAFDQGLRRIKVRSDRVKACNVLSATPSASRLAVGKSTLDHTLSREGTLDRIRPQYPDPAMQALKRSRRLLYVRTEGPFCQRLSIALRPCN